MMPINYVVGDATDPRVPGPKVLAHVCNDIGAWGAGFVLAVSRRWPQPEAQYRLWYRLRGEYPVTLGQVQLVPVEPDMWVANMIAQHGVANSSVRFCGTYAEVPPIRYAAVKTCLSKLANQIQMAESLAHASVHMPRIGCGLAGGRWDWIEPTIQTTLCEADIPTYVYDLKEAEHGER